ncbi:hypothetical protein GLYMA_09G230600v4 [Glycine max]|uniref:Uncharacterized protein n=1 Tax=Glycine max TaxID=3847 RepID=K7LFK9_SOYBN|nr:hypothetical protein JHK85_026561 [Glycine max]KRH39965.1 hypothetical protein GLYMA_09G230600v4 [Glycine max]
MCLSLWCNCSAAMAVVLFRTDVLPLYGEGEGGRNKNPLRYPPTSSFFSTQQSPR